MPIVLVANPKGGVGKSTVASNLAGYFASRGARTLLGDLDRQQSAAAWLKLRPASAAPIESWEYAEDRVARPPRGVTHVVIDTPAGIHGHLLKDALRTADRVIVPLQASIFDILATQEFIDKLAGRGELERERLGILGMRVDARTRAADQLAHYTAELGLPVLGFLRDTQNYVQLAAHGLTLWDVPASRFDHDREQWAGVISWVESGPLP